MSIAAKHLVRLVEELVSLETPSAGQDLDRLAKLDGNGLGSAIETRPTAVGEEVLVEKVGEVGVEAKDSNDQRLDAKAMNEIDGWVGSRTLLGQLANESSDTSLLRTDLVLTPANLRDGRPVLTEHSVLLRTMGAVDARGARMGNVRNDSGHVEGGGVSLRCSYQKDKTLVQKSASDFSFRE